MKTNSKDRQPCNQLSGLHESPSLRAVTGLPLRPGGFHLTERGVSRCDFIPGARIADVGCGAGVSVCHLRERFQFRAMGFDITAKLMGNDKSSTTFPFGIARAEELPLQDGCCDGVLCECVLSLTWQPELVLKEFSRVLRPGGFLIQSDVYALVRDEQCSGILTSGNKTSSSLLTRDDIESFLVDAGFDLVSWEDHTNRLKELAAQLILSCCSDTDFLDSVRALFARRARPGYYLLVAKKTDEGETRHG